MTMDAKKMNKNSIGGYARAASLTPERRAQIAKDASLARWGNASSVPRAPKRVRLLRAFDAMRTALEMAAPGISYLSINEQLTIGAQAKRWENVEAAIRDALAKAGEV